MVLPAILTKTAAIAKTKKLLKTPKLYEVISLVFEPPLFSENEASVRSFTPKIGRIHGEKFSNIPAKRARSVLTKSPLLLVFVCKIISLFEGK